MAHTGNEVVCEALVRHGVREVFGNPGTTELTLTEAIRDTPELRYVLGLAEGAVVGMADGFARASGNVGVAVLHAMPGLGNGLGMLYEALRSNTPMVVLVGLPHTLMQIREPTLHGDAARFAEGGCKSSMTVRHVDELAPVLDRAFRMAVSAPAGPIVIAIPDEVFGAVTDVRSAPSPNIHRDGEPAREVVAEAIDILCAGDRPVIVAGDGIARDGARDALVDMAEALARALGADHIPVWEIAFRSRIDFPNDHPFYAGRLPLRRSGVREALAGATTVLLAGGHMMPELFYDPGPALPETCRVIQIDSASWEVGKSHQLDLGIVAGVRSTLVALTAALAARIPAGAARPNTARLPFVCQDEAGELGASPMTTRDLVEAVGRALPPECLVCLNAMSAHRTVTRTLRFDGFKRDLISSSSGGIGDALPFAVGGKLARPDVPVIGLSGDGSAMYNVQSLWTVAHDRIPCVLVIINNANYRILELNAGVLGSASFEADYRLKPAIDFVALARGMGVDARRVDTPEALTAELAAALTRGEPFLIDAAVAERG